ncbi:hypothetical protein RJ640_011437 [Escallonia rubra]|uniref:Protein RDM1 n=1 Tax=Escallonia rubra TaxID=112253 RepID=A0AA88R0K8_9ASTE|nr:hypothetical protein RJ640_011437 [Escallonia rubra]
MKRAMPFEDPVDLVSSSSSDDESSSSEPDTGVDGNDHAPDGTDSNVNLTIDQPTNGVISEGTIIRKAQMYQDFMKQLQVPVHRGSIIPFTSWTGLGKSIKQLYGQPLHYLTNIRLKQWDQLRYGADDEHRPLDTIIHPCKAEANIWLIEEVHRLTSSHHYLARLWVADPMYHAFIDPVYPQL